MSQKIDLKDLIVIIPGILGSVLEKDGQEIWAVSGQGMRNLLFRSSNLKLGQDDPTIEDLGDGIKATRLIEDVQIVPGFFKIDGYTQTTKLITDNFSHVTKGNIYEDPEDKVANLYHFPYDWRRDNRASARILQKLINKRLKCWREHSGNPNAKVIILAHSMGGLVSRYYLEVLGGWQDCKALFTFGTPYRGSVNAINFLANGYKKLFIDLTEVMRSLTSIYQLLPIYQVLKIDNEFHRISENPVTLPNINPDRVADALKFHREIEAALETNQKEEQYSLFCTCPIVGVQQPTLQSAELKDGKIIASEALPKIMENRHDLADGDGTVPHVSAIPIEFSNRDILEIANFIGESHGALQNQEDVLVNILGKLQTVQSEADLQDIRGAIRGSEQIKGTKGIGLSLDDLYLADEPISIKAKVSEGVSFSSLNAEITLVSDQSKTQSFTFNNQDNQWVLETDNLEPGLYRVKVQTDNSSEDAPNPVHNFFEVVNLKQGEV